MLQLKQQGDLEEKVVVVVASVAVFDFRFWVPPFLSTVTGPTNLYNALVLALKKKKKEHYQTSVPVIVGDRAAEGEH